MGHTNTVLQYGYTTSEENDATVAASAWPAMSPLAGGGLLVMTARRWSSFIASLAILSYNVH
jgi:hypothetical protein